MSSCSTSPIDIDLLGRIDNSLEMVAAAMKDACAVDVEADGMSFNGETVTAARITEGAEYEGVRVRVQSGLGNARVSLQIDIGFGDVIVPGPRKVVFPVLLDFPAPELNGYTMESTIAEKFQAMVKLGILNSRMKDFYDIWMLARTFDFRREMLSKAVEKTFEKRNTPTTIAPTVFDPSFVKDGDKKVQWQGFIRKAKLADAPESFEDVVAAVKAFLEPSGYASDPGPRSGPRGAVSLGTGVSPRYPESRDWLGPPLFVDNKNSSIARA